MNNGLTKENILRVFPDVLRASPTISALGDVVAGVLAQAVKDTEKCSLFVDLTKLPEAVLDMLAVDFGVNWWEYDFNLETKQRVLANAIRVHQTKGTKGALERALASIYPGSKVAEWWEYNGDPYTFRLTIVVEGDEVSTDRHLRVLERISVYKNVRSVLDRITYITLPSEPTRAHVGTVFCGIFTRMSASVTYEGG